MAVGSMEHLRGSATKCEPLVTRPGQAPDWGLWSDWNSSVRNHRSWSMRLDSTVQMQRREFDKRLTVVLSVFLRRMRWHMVHRNPKASVMPVLGQGHSPVRRYTAPPPHWAHGIQDEVRDRNRGNTRVAETPAKRVRTTERGRGRARGWHTPVTARLRQRGQTNRQGRLRDGEWEGRQASEEARGGETGVARRRAGGTRRARGSSRERDHGDTKKKKKENNSKGGHDTQEGHVEEGGRRRWGE